MVGATTLLGDVLERAGEFGGRLAAALVLLAIFLSIARLARPLVRRWLERRNRPSYTRVFLGVYAVLVWVLGFLVAATLAFPSVQMVDLLASLGILSIAAGFAFKGILENLLAGVLLIVRDPFKSGDEISVCGYEGVVDGITIRETIVRTYDGRRVLIPNACVHAEVLEVRTHHRLVRTAFTVPIDPNSDPARARVAAERALRSVPGVTDEPPPDAILIETSADALSIECRAWTESRQATLTATRDRAIEAVLAAFRADGVPAPMEAIRVEMTADRGEAGRTPIASVRGEDREKVKDPADGPR